MDNQNANKDGILGSVSGLLGGNKNTVDSEGVKRATDARGALEASGVVIQPNNLENVQTQSIVESPREVADQELAQIKAYNDEMLRQEKAQEAKNNAKRTSIYIALGIFGIGVVVVLVWMLVNVIIAIYNPPEPIQPPDPTPEKQYDKVDGYDCKTEKCYKVTDVPDGRIILRDNQYYVYDTKTKDLQLTTIENQEYHDMIAFEWGKGILIELDPESDYSGLYSLTENRMLTGFNYDSFYRDIENESYKEMNWAEGNYIVARKDGYYRLIRLVDGKEVIRGANRVFVHDGFCISYESGERRLYTLEGKQIRQVLDGEQIFIKGNYAIVIREETNMAMYNNLGEDVYEGSEYEHYSYEVNTDELLSTLRRQKIYYEVPAK